jgi:hypothetical protein
MRRSRFSDEQTLAIVKEGGSGRKVSCLVRAYGITEHTCCRRTSKYSGLELSGL